MDHLRRVARFWNWLPAFRAVAESQHLPTASRELNVTSPALSRAIQLLERDLGVPLFRRVGRRLELGESGQRFLDALRDAMRLVHEATLQVREETFSGTVHIGSIGAITTTLLAPALERLLLIHPELLPVVITPSVEDVAAALRRGKLDIVFHGAVGDLAGLTTELLGTIESAVYCGRTHPLWGRENVTPEEVLQHHFVAPPPDAAAHSPEGWPSAVPRRIAVHVDQVRVGVEICLRGKLLAVLPDDLVRASPLGGSLWRLPFPDLARHPVFATHRTNLPLRTRHEVVLEAVREVLERQTG